MVVSASAAVILVAVGVAAVLGVFSGGSSRATKATSRRVPVTVPTTGTTPTTQPPTGSGVIPKSSNPVVALAQQYDGRYVGMFTNTTFHTTGPATLDVSVNPNSGVLTAAVELNGDLFGGGAKIVRRIDGTVTLGDPNATVVVSHTSTFGPVTGKLGAGTSIVLTAPNVPDTRVKTFELTGTLRTDVPGFDATFTVGFRDGRTAQGVVTVLCAPQGQRASQVITVCRSA
jgi:hypothetical protein